MKKSRVGLVIAGIFVTLAGVQMHQVHDDGWEWRLWRSDAPPRVRYDDRDYSRGAQTSPPEDLTLSVKGRTPGGGEILDTDSPGTTTLIWVRDGGTTWIYGLLGGP